MNTILYVRKWRKTVEFYGTTLGLSVTHENDWFVEFRVSNTARLSIADHVRATIPPGGGTGITLTWQVDDAERAWTRLRELGVATGPVRDHAWGARVFHLHDPEGHRLEIWSSHERA